MTIPMTPAPGDGGPGAAPLAAPRAKIRPGRIWYLVGLLVFLGGVAWVYFGLTSVISEVNSFPRAPIPAGGQVSLDHAGGYVVYYEGPGAQSGRVPDVRVRVTPASASAAVQSLAPYNGTQTYGIGSHQGIAVLTLQVTRPGRFTVETSGAADVPAGSDLAFGDSIAGGILGPILIGVLLILAGLATLLVIFIVRIVKTNRARSPVPAWSPPTPSPSMPSPAQPPSAPSPVQPPPVQPPSAQPPPVQSPSAQPPPVQPPPVQPPSAQPPPVQSPQVQPPPVQPPSAQPPPVQSPQVQPPPAQPPSISPPAEP